MHPILVSGYFFFLGKIKNTGCSNFRLRFPEIFFKAPLKKFLFDNENI